MTQRKASRPKLPPISEEMKAWSAALATEVETWPQVTTRSFFGLTALYRKVVIFGVLPRTRGIETPNSLGIRFENPSPAILARLKADSRLSVTEMQSSRWFIFEISSGADLQGALEWLSRSYEAAGKKAGKKKKSR